MKKSCLVCCGLGWHFVNEWIGPLQGRKGCKCKTNIKHQPNDKGRSNNKITCKTQ